MSNITVKSKQAPAVDFEKIIETPEFKALVSRKTKFMTHLYHYILSGLYFTLPILTGIQRYLIQMQLG